MSVAVHARGRYAGVLLALACVAFPCAAGAQGVPAIVRAMDFEQRGRSDEAIAAYREALASRDMLSALLGIERLSAELGRSGDLVPLADSIARAHPRETLVQVVRLRTLLYARRSRDAAAAYREWAATDPASVAPFREYARLLLDAGRLVDADSVLRAAFRVPGGETSIAAELARLDAARGSWAEAARRWRLAVEASSSQGSAAIYSLGEAGEAQRDGVRAVLRAAPVSRAARQLLAGLELNWGSSGAAWNALADLPVDDASAAAWSEFAGRAESREEWGVARDAWRAVLRVRCDPAAVLHAADASLLVADAASALVLLDDPRCMPRGPAHHRAVAALRVRALALAGRPAEAARALDAASAVIDEDDRRALASAVAWGWVRAGDVAQARQALGPSLGGDTTGVIGWLALYEGDLATARHALRSLRAPSADAVAALAVLTRTRAARAPALGQAFLLLARGDSGAALGHLALAITEVPEAAPALLAVEARVRTARGDPAGAEAAWRAIIERHGSAPEAPEADLAWARALAARGESARARERLEHLILSYPSSALVPQARRALDALGGVQ